MVEKSKRLKEKPTFEDVFFRAAFSIAIIFLSVSLIGAGFTGISNVRQSSTNTSYDGEQSIAPNETPAYLLLNESTVLLGPDLAVNVSLSMRPAYNYTANGVANLDLVRYGFAFNPGLVRKEITFGIQSGSYLNQSLEFYSLEQNYFYLTLWLAQRSDPINVSWHVNVVSLDFGLSTFSPLLIIIGSIMLIERIRLHIASYRGAWSIRETRLPDHSAAIFTVLVGILLFPASEFSHSVYYFSIMGLSQLASLNSIQLASAGVLAFPVVLYLFNPRITRRRYNAQELGKDNEIAQFLRRKFGSLNLCSFPSDQPNAFIVGLGRYGPEIAISTGLIKEFETAEITESDVANIVSHELAHFVNLDFLFWNFGRILRDNYKYWAAIYVIVFWLAQLVRVNPYGGAAPIAYMRISDLIAGLRFFITGQFAGAKYILPFLDVNVIGEFLSILAFLLIIPYFVLSLTLRESELAADKQACISFTTRDSMSETLTKILRSRFRKVGILSFSQDLTPSQRIKNLNRPILSVDIYAPVRNGVAIGIVSFAMFTLFDTPIETLFLLPVVGVSLLQILRNYSVLKEARPLNSLGKIGAGLQKMGLESVMTGVAYLTIALAITVFSQELQNFGGLVAAAATGLIYVPLAAFLLSSFLILFFIRS